MVIGLIFTYCVEFVALNSRSFFLFSFFLHVHTREGRKIQTNDLHFMMYDSQPIELSLETFLYANYKKNYICKLRNAIIMSFCCYLVYTLILNRMRALN
jgi:hypothetical protein